jgi:hypothetical protein
VDSIVWAMLNAHPAIRQHGGAPCHAGSRRRAGEGDFRPRPNGSFVVVIGRPTGYGFPTVLLATSCGVTQARIEGAKLVLHTSGGLPGAVYPGAKQPTFVFSWQQGRLQTSATDFYKYCASHDDYLMSH